MHARQFRLISSGLSLVVGRRSVNEATERCERAPDDACIWSDGLLGGLSQLLSALEPLLRAAIDSDLARPGEAKALLGLISVPETGWRLCRRPSTWLTPSSVPSDQLREQPVFAAGC
ncbi:MAG: hypothetical protein PVG27_10410 [Chloroflexota bacterium]|jgi:hypothetical protein